jgi:transcriptional regulator with XRE-family HTH domain
MGKITGLEAKYHFGKMLSEILLKRDLRQRDLSRLSGVSESYISQILSEKKEPDFVTLKKICSALNVDVGFFMMKLFMEAKLPDSEYRDFVMERILPALKDLDKILYEGKTSDTI